MREDKEAGDLHEGRETDGGAGVVAEDEEGRPEGPELGQGEPVHNRRHGVLTNTEMEVLAAGAVRLEVAGALVLQSGLVGWAQVRRASQEPGDVLRQDV